MKPCVDQCTHCVVKGDIAKCLKTPCSQHESWMVGELRRALAETGCHELFCEEFDQKCGKCPCRPISCESA